MSPWRAAHTDFWEKLLFGEELLNERLQVGEEQAGRELAEAGGGMYAACRLVVGRSWTAVLLGGWASADVGWPWQPRCLQGG